MMCFIQKSKLTLRFTLFCSVAPLLFFFHISMAAAQNLDSQIAQLINSGQIKSAQEVLEASNPSETARLFFAGRVFKASQNYLVAIAIFREVIDRDPNRINAKRELAHTLLLAGEFENAETYFYELLQIDKNEIMQNGYRRFLGVIARHRPSAVSLKFSLLPSSNINKGTDNAVFDSELGELIIEPSIQAESGVGIQFELSGFFRRPASAQSRMQLNWAVSSIKYGNENYDNITGLLSVSYEKRTLNRQWSLSAYTRHIWRKGGADINTLGGKYEFEQKLSLANSIALSLLHEYTRYPLSGYQDGPFASGAVSITHQFDIGSNISGGIRVEHSYPMAEHLQYLSHSAFGNINRIWSEGTQTAVGFQIGRREFIGIYPLTSSSRVDIYSGINFSVQNSGINYRGFTPKLSCGYYSNYSNISFFDYDATDCHIEVSTEF